MPDAMTSPGPTGGMPLPIGFDQKTLADYYKSITTPIEQDTAANVGARHSDAIARGLEGTQTDSGGMAAAQAYGDQNKYSTLSNLAFNMSGLSNQDALIKQQQQWQSGENSLQRQYGLDMERNKELYGFEELNRENSMAQRASLGNFLGAVGAMAAKKGMSYIPGGK